MKRFVSAGSTGWGMIMLLLASCASPPERETTPFQTVAIVPAEYLTAVGRAESKTDRATEGAGKGALGGIAVGTAAGLVLVSSMCGPAAGLCGAALFPVVLLSGVAVGTAGGMLYGLKGVSHTDALYVNEALSSLDEKHDFQQELIAAIQTRLRPDVQAEPGVADVRVVAKLDRIDFVQHSADDIRIKAKGSMTFDRRDASYDQSMDQMTFEAESGQHDIDTWLADDGRELGAAIERCIVDLSAEMSSTLMRLSAASASDQS